MKKLATMLIALILTLTVLCGAGLAEEKSFKIGICNFVDDASLNQIIANIRTRLGEIETEKGVTF